MSVPLLVEYFNALPEDARHGNLDWPVEQSMAEYGEEPSFPSRPGNKARRRAAVHLFQKNVQTHYLPGTLLRLLSSPSAVHRQAAAFALGLLGNGEAVKPLVQHLHDRDNEVASLACNALWSLWFRGNDAEQSNELHRVLRLRDPQKMLAGLDALIERAPNFAEARNQRALLYFRQECYDLAVRDCQAVLELEANHFGALAALGQCYLRLDRHKAALRAFRSALRINPRLRSIAERVRKLENTLDEDGR